MIPRKFVVPVVAIGGLSYLATLQLAPLSVFHHEEGDVHEHHGLRLGQVSATGAMVPAGGTLASTTTSTATGFSMTVTVSGGAMPMLSDEIEVVDNNTGNEVRALHAGLEHAMNPPSAFRRAGLPPATEIADAEGVFTVVIAGDDVGQT